MSSSYNYEKALSLEWNGQLYVLTVRNETPLGAINYLYSYDGQSWYSSSDLSNSQLLTQANPYNVKWMGTNFAMVGNIANTAGNTILRSTTGTKFSALSTTGQGTNAPLYDLEANLEYPHTITFPRNMTLALGGAAGDTTKIAYSLDAGITWTPSINSSTVFSTTANNAVWNGKLWVAVGQGGNTIATSTDGNTWIGRGSYIFTVAGQGIAWSPEQALWVAAGQGTNSLAYSADGVYWTGVGTAMLGSGSDVQWNGTIWSAVGGPSAANKSIAYSYDGKTWSNPIQTNLFDISGNKTAWNGYFWTAIGSSTFSNSLYNMGTSVDGIYWYMQRNTNISTNITNIFTNPSITNEILFTTYGIPPDAATGLTATSSTASTITFLFTPPSSVTMPVNSMLTNCLFWFDAANTNSYTLGTGTTVASLVDSTGFGLVNTSMKQFRNSTGTPAISLTSNYINSLSAININNSGFIGTLTTAYTGIRMSFYYVVNVVTSNNSVFGRMLSLGQGGITGISGTSDITSLTTSCLILQSNTAPPQFTNFRNSVPNTYYSFVANTANILSGYYDGANLYTFLNGTSVGTNPASVGAFNVNNFGIGLDTFSNGNFADNIYLAEALVFMSSPGTYQRQIMEGYLASKWGITSSLPAGHPYKSVAPVPSVSMTLLQNCVLWLDAADATTYTTSGSNVTQWNDKSGAGNNVVQASAASQPLTGTTLNGLNIMNFTGTKWMTNTTMIFPLAPYTIFVVGYTSVAGYGRLLASFADVNLFFGTGTTVTQFSTFVGNGSSWNDTNTNTPATSVTSACIMCMTNNGTATGMIPYINGVTITAKSGVSNVFTGFCVGAGNGGTQPWGGYIAEIMVYNYVLSTQQRQYVEGYLAGKWGIQSSLATLHPYKSIAPDTAMINNVNPTILANCIMWLDAADTSTLLLNGTNVLQWNDKSGSNNNASQTNATYQFTRDAAAQNGKGIIYTGTTLGYMTVPNIVVPVTNTVFIVAYTTVAPGTTACAISSTSDLQMRLNGTTGGVWINLGNSSAWNTANSTYGAGSINIISWTENATSVVIYGNGNKGGSNNGANVGYTGIVLGSNNFVTQVASNSQPWLGYIAEVLVYNRVIPTAQRQYIEGYLANKWGFKSGLPTNHPYYTATPPTNGIKLNNINSNILQTCLLWLDAADSDTLILSGANLMQWNDKSGNNNNATKFDTGTQPTYGATNFNSLPGIQMSTNQGFYAPMTSGITTNGISVFVVFQKNGANNTSETIFSRTSSNIAAPLDLYQSSRLYGTAASTNSSFTANFNIQNATTATLFNIVVSNTNWSEWVNGTLSTSNTITALFDNSSFFYIGTRADHLTYFTGVIAELMVYNSALPVAQRQYIEGYLAWKWNLKANLPVSHPYYSSGPTISTINPIVVSAASSNLPSSYSILAAPSTGSSVTQTINYGATGGTATGLTPSTSYNLTLASVNSLGSSTSNTVTYQTILSPPTNLTFVTYSVSSINISFTPPVMSQGVTITSYTATAVPASGTTVTVSGISGAATSVNITGLEASTQYSITMVAINSYGTSASSSPLVYQTVLRPPYSIFAYMVDATSMSVSYVAPALGTNVSVTSYTASIVPTTGSTIVISNITSSPFTVTGLTYQMNYNISMISINSYSTSTSSAITNYSLSVLLTINGIVSGSTGTGLIAGNVANDVKSGASTSNSVIYNVYSFQPGTNILPPVATSSQTTYTISYSNGIATTIYVLAVGGGGGAGTFCGGGGGAGGVVMNSVILPAGTGTINVNVGAGGLGQGTDRSNYDTPKPVNGSNSTVTFSANTNANIVAYGGGFGQGLSPNNTLYPAGNGGSGGGAGCNGGILFGKAISQNNNYGNPGSLIGASNSQGCGGGGAGNVGTQNISTVNASNGGAGIQCFLPGITNFSPSGTPYGTYYWGGGGGGGGNGNQAGNGGIGGGGGGTSSGATTTLGGIGGGLALNAGGNGTYYNLAIPGAGGTNTGGGGGASVHNIAASGGSGIVIIAFPSNVSITNNQSAVLPPAINSSGLYKAVLNDASFSAAAYSSIKGAYACRLLNYNYFGPVVTLRYNTDTTGSFTQNFYSDICGNMGTSYLGTGQSVSSWLSSNSAVTTYAFVTKWYSQGMDISFNSATQYTTSAQPIYDLSNGLLNFGYTTAGAWVTAPQAGCYFNLPNGALPYNNESYSYVARHYNIQTTTTSTFIAGGGTSGTAMSGLQNFELIYDAANVNGQGTKYISSWVNLGATTSAITYAANNVLTSLYTGSNLFIVVNGTKSSIAASSHVQTNLNNAIGYNLSRYNSAQTTNSWALNGQLYNLYAFNTALSDADRLLVEATPYQYSPLAQITLTLTSIAATTFVTTWPAVANVDTYIMYINGSAYGTVTSGQTITPGYNGPWITNLYAYDASYRLLARGYINAYVMIVNSVVSGSTGTGLISGSVSDDVKSGTSTTNGITYNVYSFEPGYNILPPAATSSQTTYTINYTCGLATTIYVLAVGGGAGGNSGGGGGGGAGGVVMTPIVIPSGTSTILVSVGAGGTSSVNGSNTTVNFTANSTYNIIAYGGGNASKSGNGYTANTALGAVSSNNYLNYANYGGGNTAGITGGGGGGGAGTPGNQGIASVLYVGGNGGSGIQCFLPGITNFTPAGTSYGTYYWGGGGGGGSQTSANTTNNGNGGIGGGGGGANLTNPYIGGVGGIGLNNGGTGSTSNLSGGNGGNNTGGGGGGAWNGTSGTGGSGIVTIAFPSNTIITNNRDAVIPPATNSVGLYKSVFNDASFSAAAYNTVKCAFSCRLLNYNYFGPVMTLRNNLDTTGSFTQNFYSDISGNLGTGYLGTGQSLSAWLTSNMANMAVSPNNNVGNTATWISNGVTWTADSTYASSNYPAYIANRAFDGNLTETTSWSANGNSYTTASSTYYLYSGGTTYQTIISGGVGTIGGEWMQISSNIPVSLSSFSFGSPHGTTDTYSGRIPGQFYIVGSNTWTGTSQSWTPIAYCVFTGNPYLSTVTNTYTYTYNIPSGTVTSQALTGNMTITTYGNSASAFTYYRFVATALLGTTGSVLFSANGLMIGEWVLNCVTGPNPNTTYAYVTKWYNQGMDMSFNCATQYALTSQPIYDVSNSLINFGYTSSGVYGSGWTGNAGNAYFNLPNSALPFADASYTYVTTLGNVGQYVTTQPANINASIISAGTNTNGNAFMISVVNSVYFSQWYVTAAGGFGSWNSSTGNATITTQYASGSGTVYDYLNSTLSSTLTSTGTRSQNSTANYIGYSTIWSPYNGKLYNLFVFNSSLTSVDRLSTENTPYQYSVLPTISGLSATTISANSFTLTWTTVSSVSYYILWVNGAVFTTYEASATTKTITHTDTGPWQINLYAYNSANVLLASGALTTSVVMATASASINYGAITTTNGSNTVFTFTSSGTFTPQTTGYASVLIVGGGGGGGANWGGGGGAGGLVYFDNIIKPMFLTAGTTYTVTIGTGGAIITPGNPGNDGTSSVFNNIIANGGGGGNCYGNQNSGRRGGCGGGGCGSGGAPYFGGKSAMASYASYYTGRTSGGAGYINLSSGGGGGAGSDGGAGTLNKSGSGGQGYCCNITGTPTFYAGGGGGMVYAGSGTQTGGTGGSGGGGAGSTYVYTSGIATTGSNATFFGSGGGGGSPWDGPGGSGSNGVVIISCPGMTIPNISITSITGITATTFVLNWATVAGATSHILNINGTNYGTTYGAVTTTGTVTPGVSGPWTIILYAYNSSSVLLAMVALPTNSYKTIDPTNQLFYYTFEPSTINNNFTLTSTFSAGLSGLNPKMANIADGLQTFDAYFSYLTGGSNVLSTYISSTTSVSGTSSLYCAGNTSFNYSLNKSAYSIGTNGISFSWWMNTTMSTFASTCVWTIGGGNSANQNGFGQYGIWCQINSATNLTFYTYNNSTNVQITLSATCSTITNGTWHHFCLTVNSSGTANVYQNNSIIVTNGTFYYPFTTANINKWDTIGAGVNNGNYLSGNFYTGYIDNFRVYKRVITSTEASVLYLCKS